MFFVSSVTNELTRSMRRAKAKWVPDGGNRFFYNTCPSIQTSSSARWWEIPTTRTFMSSALNVLDEIPYIRVHCIWIDPRSLRSIMYELRLLAVRCFPALILEFRQLVTQTKGNFDIFSRQLRQLLSLRQTIL